MASIVALRRIQAAGTSRFGKLILRVITGSLILANLSNIYQLFWLTHKSVLFLVLDAFWPISNLLMLVVGVAVVQAKVLVGWHRFVPLLVGLWFPLTALGMALIGRDSPIMIFVPYYSAIAWTLLANFVRTTSDKPSSKKVFIPDYQVV